MEREFAPKQAYAGMTVPSNEGYVLNALKYTQASQTPPYPRDPYRIAGEKRLTEQLGSTTRREIVAFNCIGFGFVESRSENGQALYPESHPEVNNPLHISEWYQQDLKNILQTIRLSGPARLTVLVPDSEFNKNVLNLPYDDAELQQKAQILKRDLQTKLTAFEDDEAVTVETMTEYCVRNGLPSPYELTDRMYQRITTEPPLMKKIKGYMKNDVKGYLINKGLDPDYVNQLSPAEVESKLTYYYAMYMAEGQILAQGNAMMIDIESNGRVRSWMGIGAEDQLPIITAVNTTSYKDEMNRRNTVQEDRV